MTNWVPQVSPANVDVFLEENAMSGITFLPFPQITERVIIRLPDKEEPLEITPLVREARLLLRDCRKIQYSYIQFSTGLKSISL